MLTLARRLSPAFYTSLAERMYARRWWLCAIAVVGSALFAAVLLSGATSLVTVAATLAGPLIFVPWMLFCICIWFHPSRGNLQLQSRLVGKLPRFLQSAVRWYASLVLSLSICVGSVVWPALSLTWPRYMERNDTTVGVPVAPRPGFPKPALVPPPIPVGVAPGMQEICGPYAQLTPC